MFRCGQFVAAVEAMARRSLEQALRKRRAVAPAVGRAVGHVLEPLENRVMLSVFTPTQMRQAYGFIDQNGANLISFNGTAGDGSGQTIAIVVPYNNPNITEDASYAGLNGPGQPTFSVYNQTGGTDLSGVPSDPTNNTQSPHQFDREAAQDVEWAHYIAPGAKIVVVEANSNRYSDLIVAEQTAAGEPGVSVVSNSWGGAEPPTSGGQGTVTLSQADAAFTTPLGHQGVTFLAGAGDHGADSTVDVYPASSPNVISVGGTSLVADPQGRWSGESAWSLGGGGLSPDEPPPSYQAGNVNGASSSKRAFPDVAMDGDTNTGGSAYDVTSGGTFTANGSSLATPMWAGIIAIVDQGRALASQGSLNTDQALWSLYSLSPSCFHDITGGNNGYPATSGYDLATGLGTPIANVLIPAMSGYSIANQLAFTSPAITISAGTSGLPTVTVQVENSQGTVLTGDNSPVTLSVYDGLDTGIGVNAGPVNTGGTVTVNAVNGVATFTGLWLTPAPNLGGAYKLEASDGADLDAALNLTINAASAHSSATPTTVAAFSDAANGYGPASGLSIGPDGALYGTTQYDGPGSPYPAGTLFQFKNGTLTTLASFSSPNQYTSPYPSGSLAIDSNGDVFGTTQFGGSYGDGTVFEVAAGSGTITTLFTFNNGAAGGDPVGGLVMDGSGNLYGTTYQGGTAGGGTIFKVDAASHTLSTVASFDPSTGTGPQGPLTIDAAGDLFGTTTGGGIDRNGDYNTTYGTVFDLPAGGSTILRLASFSASVGQMGNLSVDSAGNVFGATTGFSNPGFLYEVKSGSNRVTTLASFSETNENGSGAGGVTLDRNGNLFGTTYGRSGGAVFELAAGATTITTLADFSSPYPVGSLALDSHGNIFGNTYGTYGGIFELPAFALPVWLAPGSAARWDPSQNLTLTGKAIIIADPAKFADLPIVQANDGNGQLLVQPTDGSLFVHLGGLSLQGGATADVSSKGSARTHNNHEALVLGTVNGAAPLFSVDAIHGSKLDLEDNDMIIHNGSYGSVQALAQTGRGVAAGGVLDGTWTGNGLTSSKAAARDAADGLETLQLAVARNADLPLGQFSQWAIGGQNEQLRADGNDIIVKYTYTGDFTLEGSVGNDASTVFSLFFDGGASTGNSWALGDTNGDGKIDDSDATAFSLLFGNGIGGTSGAQL